MDWSRAFFEGHVALIFGPDCLDCLRPRTGNHYRDRVRRRPRLRSSPARSIPVVSGDRDGLVALIVEDEPNVLALATVQRQNYTGYPAAFEAVRSGPVAGVAGCGLGGRQWTMMVAATVAICG
jgi:hypothetical protein